MAMTTPEAFAVAGIVVVALYGAAAWAVAKWATRRSFNVRR